MRVLREVLVREHEASKQPGLQGEGSSRVREDGVESLYEMQTRCSEEIPGNSMTEIAAGFQL